ncbi:MAG TPA: sulfatase-like hydrolase/transferase [Streptosporangiaceae bacterium]
MSSLHPSATGQEATAERLEPTGTTERSGGDGPSRRRRVAGRVTTALACLLVLFALVAPNDFTRFTPAMFVRIPLEGLLVAALAIVLRGRPRPLRAVAIVAGVLLGLLAMLKILDIGFYEALNRPFHPVFDWPFLGAGAEFLGTTAGRAAGIAAIVVTVLIAVGVLGLMTLAVLRLLRIVGRHTAVAVPGVAVLGVAWVACAALGAQLVPGTPLAADAAGRLMQVPADLRDHSTFAAQLRAYDRFQHTPPGQLLGGLRGKDVILSFVESYGRVAVNDPGVAATLATGDSGLRAAGFAARSAFLTSPTFGGGSWLAHGTLLSGLWTDNQQRYDSLVHSDRFTLTKAFRTAGWRTVAVMPGNTKPWSEAAFYGDQHVYDHWNMGYRGPGFNWGTPPDQYTLSAFQRFERAAPHHAPVMAEMPLVTSHSPWAPTPKMVGWSEVGDGSIYGPMAKAGDQPADVWRSPARVRAAYMRTIQYSLTTLFTYMETYGGDDMVLVYLGDHQPAPIVSGPHAGHDVPVTIIARDPAVLARISGWGWQDGVRPGPAAPVWRMDTFRDRFLTAFGGR